ncbi:MAG: UvrD-helicase domain-containing protein [Patescibacteria group bacterium]
MANLLESLNPEQKAAAEHETGPALVISGPGSGKTRVLSHRIANLIENKGVLPENILAVTFTNKAAGEMRERVSRLLGDLGNQRIRESDNKVSVPPITQLTNSPITRLPWLGTFHSICAKILRREAHALGLSPSFTIYDESDSLSAIRQAIKKINLPDSKVSPSAVASIISSAKNELLDAKMFAPYAAGYFQQQATKVFFEYEKILTENGALDFDDLILKTVRLFKEDERTLEKYHRQFEYILIDEYQDTNMAQYSFSKILAEEHKNIFVVGDMAQAIYSFRGANYRNILNFEKDYPTARIYNLSQNYRSSKNIIKAAKNIIERNSTHLALDLWTENTDGEKVAVRETVDETDEADFIVEEIVRRVGEINSHLSDFAVLYRTNAQSRPLEEALLRVGLPYTIVGGTRFYERKEIKDVLSHLRLVQNPHDSVSLERLEKIGKRKKLTFQVWLEKTLGEDSEFIAKHPTLEILDKILTATSYLEDLDDGTEEGLGRMENVKELRSVAEEFPVLTDFLENVTLIQQETLPNGRKVKNESDQNRVVLMTLHAAKGLEFPVVFLSGLEEGLFPHSRSLLERSELEEERRLCYVGITRAKNLLYLTFCRRRLLFGSRQANMPSRFLSEIPADLIDFQSRNNI